METRFFFEAIIILLFNYYIIMTHNNELSKILTNITNPFTIKVLKESLYEQTSSPGLV